MTDAGFFMKLMLFPYPDLETYEREVERPVMPAWPCVSLLAGTAALRALSAARWIGLWLGPAKEGLLRLHRRAARVRWCMKTVEERRSTTGVVGLSMMGGLLLTCTGSRKSRVGA